ncbi:hypothetical protein HX878_20665 [Pseudomonas veronii]|uniref:hypothetical protein n=1 Tax=Pseudomonas veronii TaxID=76761 RepID=UPI0015A4E28C|nr:hypothetical protein [Pseudomonas veronii]NWD57147.1 hypothetical protein [Pseudomonas veronii]
MKDEHEDIELKEVLEQSFAAGHGVVTLLASMTDEQILTLIKSACTWSKGKAFQVIPSQPKAVARNVEAFEFNPLWPTRTDPVFVVRTLEKSAGTNLDTDQRFAICAVLDGLPVGASMRDFVVVMKARDAVALGITPEQYTALEPIFETMQTWQELGAYGHLFTQDADA